MLKLNFSRPEFEELKQKLFFSELQLQIIEFRCLEYSREKMAALTHNSVPKIDREIRKIAEKIAKVI